MKDYNQDKMKQINFLNSIIKKNKGYSLIELLMAALITSFIVLAAADVFISTEKIVSFFSKQANRFLEKNFAYQVIREDLMKLYPSFNYAQLKDDNANNSSPTYFFDFIHDRSPSDLCIDSSTSRIFKLKAPALNLISPSKSFIYLAIDKKSPSRIIEPIYMYDMRTSGGYYHTQHGSVAFNVGKMKTYLDGIDLWDVNHYLYFYAAGWFRSNDNTNPKRHNFLYRMKSGNSNYCQYLNIVSNTHICKDSDASITNIKLDHAHYTNSSKIINTMDKFLRWIPGNQGVATTVIGQKVRVIEYYIKNFVFNKVKMSGLFRKTNDGDFSDEVVLAVNVDEVIFKRPCIAQVNVGFEIKFKEINY